MFSHKKNKPIGTYFIMSNIQGKVVIITGASSVIGEATTKDPFSKGFLLL